MEKRYYIDGKCVLSYDDDVFSTDDDYTNIKELFIYPAVDKVYVKYYEKQLVQQVLEKTLKKNGYSVAAEPPVRRGESHLSGLTEPPLFSVYSYCA